MNCRVFHVEIEDQQHLLNCEYLQKDDEKYKKSKYSDIYDKDPKLEKIF